MEKGSGTRSGLLWEVERLLKECYELNGSEGLPAVLLLENVPQVHGTKNRDSFNAWLNFLSSLGYKSFWKDLNAKDFGIPQSRNRCFCVSILGDYVYEFPEPIELVNCMADLLEEEVDERYRIRGERADALIEDLLARGVIPEIIENGGVAHCQLETQIQLR